MSEPSPSPQPTLPGTVRQPTSEALDLRTLLHILWAQKWVVLFVTALVGGLVTAWTVRQPRVYEAVASIEYDPSAPRPLGTKVEDVAAPAFSFFNSREFYETQNRILSSRVVAEMVVRRLGLHRDADFIGVAERERVGWQGATMEQAAEAVRGRLTVEQVRDTRIVLIKVRDTDRERATRIANAVVDAYVEKTMNDRMSSTVSALEWLGTQVDELQGELATAEESLHDFKVDHDVLSLSMEDRQNLIANEMELLSRSVAETHVRRIELQSRVAELRAAVDADPLTNASPAMRDLDNIGALRAQLRIKVAEQESLRTRYGVEHPRMVALSQEITQIRTDLRNEVEAVLRAAESELREVQSTERGLQRALDQANTRGIELNRWEMEYGQLVRQRDSKAALYDLVLKRSAETDLTRMLRTTHVRPVDRAIVPHIPVAPRVSTNVAVGLLVGLLLGLGIAFTLERMDRRIRSVEDIESLGVAVIGVVPRMDSSSQRGPRRRRAAAEASGAKDLIAHTSPLSGIAENLRTIRTNLAFMGGDGGLRSFVVTSAAPREGKSTLVANLAITLAQNGKRVLLVDTDLRRPRLHRVFKLSSRRGITTALVGEAQPLDVVLSTEIPGLDFVPCGPIPPNPSELLHSSRFKTFLSAVREKYDHIVFDSPPLGAVTDAAILGAQLEGTLIVVKAQSTTREALRGTARQMRDVGGRLIGAIFNDVDVSNRRYGEGGYYYYHRTGEYYTDEEGGPSDKGQGPKPSDESAPAKD